MAEYLAGVDIGTSGAKAMIFDTAGNPLSQGYYEYPCTYPRPGWVEQDAELVISSVKKAIRDAVESAGVPAGEIRGIAASAQRCCGIILDDKNRQIRPMISWQDNRSTEEAAYIEKTISPDEYYRKTGFPNSTTWLLSKILWLRKNEPDVWNRTARIVQMHDYFLYSMGAGEFYVDHNDAGFFGIFDGEEEEWDRELLGMFDIPPGILPVPMQSGIRAGEVSSEAAAECGLEPGTPLAIGAGDQSAGALGAGVVRSGVVSISMGTAGAVTAYLDRPFRDPAGKTMITSHPLHGSWLVEGYQAAAASVYRWFREELGGVENAEAEKTGRNFYEFMNEKVAQVPPGSRGLLVLPYFAAAATPRYNPEARGTIIGLTFSHTRIDLARAFMEGITLDMKDMLNSLITSGTPVTEARILGGPTKSSVWNQIQADVYGIPVETLSVTDATVVGAAVLAGVGAGIFDDIRSGADRMVSTDIRYEPRGEFTGRYEKLYAAYCDAFDQLDSGKVFTRISSLQRDAREDEE